MIKNIQYKKLIRGSYLSILSKVIKNDYTEIDLFFSKLSSNYKSHIMGLHLIMEEHAKNGCNLMTSANCHLAHSCGGINIYEYRKGRLRVYWFYDAVDKNIVICSHGVIKRTQQTSKEDKDKSVKEFKTYHNNREFIEVLEED